MFERARAFVVLSLLAVGCTKPTNEATSDAGPAVAKNAAAGDPVVDLLHTVDATVAVSSKVDNPHDYPEHLVDGKSETAWNGKTGDLNGYIAFRVPKSARVLRVEITPGFDRVGPKGDLFTMNHRIKKVRVSREGTVLKEATLDVAQRKLQAIELDAPGGDFKVDVLETVPGTEKGWRELTVSEFRVWGRAGGAPENSKHIPRLAIGSLDGQVRAKAAPKGDFPRGPAASVAELCASYDKVATPLINAKYNDAEYPGIIPGPHCAEKNPPEGFSKTAFRHGAFQDAAFVVLNDVERSQSALFLQTSKGWFRTDVRAWTRDHEDPGCLHAETTAFEDVTFATTSTGQDVALIRLVMRDIQWGRVEGAENGADSKEVVYACRVDAAGAPSCEGPKVAATAHEPLPPTFDPGNPVVYRVDLAKIPWIARKKPAVGPAGDFRLE